MRSYYFQKICSSLVLYKTYRDIESCGKLGTKNLIHVVMKVNVKDELSPLGADPTEAAPEAFRGRNFL